MLHAQLRRKQRFIKAQTPYFRAHVFHSLQPNPSIHCGTWAHNHALNITCHAPYTERCLWIEIWLMWYKLYWAHTLPSPPCVEEHKLSVIGKHFQDEHNVRPSVQPAWELHHSYEMPKQAWVLNLHYVKPVRKAWKTETEHSSGLNSGETFCLNLNTRSDHASNHVFHFAHLYFCIYLNVKIFSTFHFW